MILEELISAILQLLAFTLIPFLVYIIRQRSVKGFFQYIGLKPSNRKANAWALATSLIFIIGAMGLVFISPDFKEALTAPGSITGKFRAMGFGVEAVVALLLIALIKTSLAEEILFRGFLAKRLIHVLGFQWGNLLQAALFGLIHLLLFISITSSFFFPAFIFVFSGLGAYISAYINEKMADGSIIPGWIAHGLANVVSYSVMGFLI